MSHLFADQDHGFEEGALAQSLYFQFADRAVPVLEPLQSLFEEGLRDARLMRIWMDISSEVGWKCTGLGSHYLATGSYQLIQYVGMCVLSTNLTANRYKISEGGSTSCSKSRDQTW